jgi:hypothetical protein
MAPFTRDRDHGLPHLVHEKAVSAWDCHTFSSEHPLYLASKVFHSLHLFHSHQGMHPSLVIQIRYISKQGSQDTPRTSGFP